MTIDGTCDLDAMLIFVFDETETIRYCSPSAENLLGTCGQRHLSQLVEAASTKILLELATTLPVGVPPTPSMLTLLTREGSMIAVAAQVGRITLPDHSSAWRVTAIPTPGFERWINDLVQSKALLESFAELSSEAMWCIEFSEPVDLSVDDDDVIRQVFENDCHWLMCNSSMARIYNLPPGLDLNKQPVAQYFPRTAENEAFVRQILEANFSIDGVLSIDTRHDGAPIYVENTVRTQIHDGHLLRMWGTVRDVTDFRRTNNRLSEEARDVSSILGAAPDAIVVVNRNREVIALNPAFERLSGWNAEQLLGNDINSILDLDCPLPGGGCWYSINRQRWLAEIKAQAGKPILCDIQSAPVDEEAPERFVLSLRPANTTENLT